jgi:hypothetical protein
MIRLFGLVLCVIAMAAGPSHAGLFAFTVNLDGPSEDPPNASPGTGHAYIVFDDAAHTMFISVFFSDLIGPTTVAHIHAATLTPGTGTAGVATQTPTFQDFPVGVTSGSYSHVFDMTLASSFRAGFITANGGTPATAEAALITAAVEGKAYLNIHTNAFPGGEIRGFLQASPIPEPASLTMLGMGALGMAGFAWRRRKQPAAG